MKAWVFVEGFFLKIVQNIKFYEIFHKMDSALVGAQEY